MEAETLPLIPLMTLICTDRNIAEGASTPESQNRAYPGTPGCATRVFALPTSARNGPVRFRLQTSHLTDMGGGARGVRVKRGKSVMISGCGFVKMAGFQLFHRTISLLILDE
jgi:hypothetical protein